MASPKLRFKEFDGDWNQVKISDYSNTVTSGSRDWAQYYSDKGDKFIRMTNLVRDGIYLDLSDLRFVDLPKDSNEGKRTSLQSGDILISITAELGKLGWINSDLGTAYINQHTALVRMNENVDSKFIAYTLSTEKYNNKLNNLNDSGAKAGLNLGTIRNFELTIPQKKEQTKIASFLSAVDEKISLLTKKHELLWQYKQGMMQKLFSQQIRFKADDGSEFGEWEETTLGEIARNISAGATPSTLKEKYWGGHIKWMSSGELNYKHVYDVEKKITELGFKSSSTKLLPKYCVLIGLAGQGKTRGTVAINYIELCTNQSIAAIHPNPKVFDHRFIFFNLDMRYQELRGLSTGDGGRGGLNLQIIRGVDLELPCLEEQTKIANFLSAIDQKIEKVAQQIEETKQWKKGLLQQMFV
nr:restriction endonuclease subunit S [Acinetobacter pittii]